MRKKVNINYKLYKNNELILNKDFDIEDKNIKKIILKKNPDKMRINNFSLFILNENSDIDLFLPKRKIRKRKTRNKKVELFINNKSLFSD